LGHGVDEEVLVDGVSDPFLAGASFSHDQCGPDMASYTLHHVHELSHDVTGNNELSAIDLVVGGCECGHSILTGSVILESAEP